MPIKFEKRASFHGRPGVVTTTISFVSRDELEKHIAQVEKKSGKTMPPEGTVVPFSEMMKKGKSLIIFNPYTGEEETIPYETIVQSLGSADLDNSFIDVQIRFQADSDGPPLYPSDMADELRQRGFDEEQIQELIKWEKEVRKSG